MLDRIHKISEIIASFAIVGSLVFVGVQLLQNTAALGNESHQAATTVWTSMSSPIVVNERLAGLYADDVYPELRPSPLVSSDNMSLITYLQAMFVISESYHQRWRDGDLPDEIWEPFSFGLIDAFITSQSAMTYWSSAQDRHGPEFRKMVNDLIPVATQAREEFAATLGEQGN